MADVQNLLAVANTFLGQLMAADSALVALVSTRIKADFILQANTTTLDPLVSFSNLSAHNILAVGAVRVYTRCLYQVVGHAAGGYGVVGPIADRITAIFGRRTGIQVTYSALPFSVDCFIEDELQLTPAVIPGGQVVYARGAKVRIYVAPQSP